MEREDHPSADATRIRATNQRTHSSGSVYRDLLLFLPTLSRPSQDVLVQFVLFPNDHEKSASRP